MTGARRMWTLLEPLHAVTYFAREARTIADSLGVRGFWMGYVAQRAAPLGAVTPAAVRASFFGFHSSRIARALPDAWSVTSPRAALDARRAGARVALSRVIRPDTPGLTEAAALALAAADAADTAGRVLAAANQALPHPADPLEALWQAATTLREHRGDGHVAVLVARGIDPVAAHLLKIAAGEDTDADLLRESRAWPDDEWAAGAADLRDRGLLDAGGRLTEQGVRERREIEDATDAVAEQPWGALGPERTERLAGLLLPWSTEVVAAGVVPVPNPIGHPAPARS